jgi:SAM-dependent methyltransferase
MADMLDMGDVPFYWRIKSEPHQSPLDIPERLPFSFTFMPELQLVIQRRDPAILGWLERVYTEDANVGYLQEGHALAQSYGGEFLSFFDRARALLPKFPMTAADIGCGGVYLLQQVRARGLSVTGIDPSPVTIAAGRVADIKIVPSFYPSSLLTERFDVMFHYDVLEHVEDPVAFLRAHHANLMAGGGVIFAVPDCTHHIQLGDVSMMLHEHLNYFDKESLARVVRAAGFEPLLLEPARHGGVLLCCAVPTTGDVQPSVLQGAGLDKFVCFRNRAQAALDRFLHLAEESAGGELGLYVPLRAFAYLGSVPGSQRLRFFDDDPGLRGRYYDGFDVPVENFSDLVALPPKQVVVCSLAFGERLAHRLKSHMPATTRVVSWTELFDTEDLARKEVAI